MNWLPDMDLNHDKQIQSLLCYRYTIGQAGASFSLNAFPGQSSRQTGSALKKSIGDYVRPQPGPLPQERENYRPVISGTNDMGCRVHFMANGRKPAVIIVTSEFQSDARSFPLSPGERAGVRASVPTKSPTSRFTFHFSRN